MKQLSNNTKINKEINYSTVVAMEIVTLDDTFMFSYSTNIIDFYIDTLKNYLPLNGINIGIDNISTTIQQELYNLLYYPIKNELFNYHYLQDKHLNDFNDIFSFMLNGSYLFLVYDSNLLYNRKTVHLCDHALYSDYFLLVLYFGMVDHLYHLI